MSNINLDGTETSIIKALGFGSGDISGADLLNRAGGIGIAEVIDAVGGLITVGYVEADCGSISDSEAFKKARFRVNSGYSRELKEALDPKPEPPKSRRVRRE